MGGRGLWRLPSPFLPAGLHFWDPKEQTQKLRNAELSWHLPPSSLLLKAQQGQPQKPLRPTKVSNWLSTHRLLERRLRLGKTEPQPPHCPLLPRDCTRLGRRASPSTVKDGISLRSKGKGRERVSGSSLASNLSCFLLPPAFTTTGFSMV